MLDISFFDEHSYKFTNLQIIHVSYNYRAGDSGRYLYQHRL